jgi:hypothetical protein
MKRHGKLIPINVIIMDRYAERIARAQELAKQLIGQGFEVDLGSYPDLNFRVNTFAGELSVACATDMFCETYVLDSIYQEELGYGYGPRNHRSLEALLAEIDRIEAIDLRAIDAKRKAQAL